MPLFNSSIPPDDPDVEAVSTGALRACWIGIVLIIISLLAFTWVQYGMPGGYYSMWGVSQRISRHFALILFGRQFRELSAVQFTIAFRVCQFGMYAGYILMAGAAYRLRKFPLRAALVLIVGLGAFMAVVFPATLSTDTYSYTAYARMPVVYHLNPYFHTPATLVAANDTATRCLPWVTDPSGYRHLRWDTPTVYGPTWTSLTVILVTLLEYHSLLSQIIAMKLIEFFALLLAVFSVHRIVKSTEPHRLPFALLGLGLNPLILVEGVGSGHNDLLLMALILLAGACLAQRRPIWAAFALGLSIGVKFISILILPWLIRDQWRKENKNRLAISIAMVCASLIPTALCFIPYWHGFATLSSLSGRSQIFSMAGPQPLAECCIPWVSAHIPFGPLQHAAVFALRQMETLVIYLALTIWILRSKPNSGWLTAWPILAGFLIFYILRIRFPWYAIWLWPAAYCRINRAHLNLLATSLSYSAVTSYFYTVSDRFLARDIMFYCTEGHVLLLLYLNYTSLKKSNNSIKSQ